MNVFFTLYCRAFQAVMRVAYPFLPYRDPKIFNDVSEIADELKRQGKRQALIVTGKTVNSLGKTEKLKESLAHNGIGYTVFDSTVANPTVENVNAAYSLYKSEGCDAIIGFGGGSPIDCAKAVGSIAARKNVPLQKMQGGLCVRRKTPYLIAVPTTSGTGSEVTPTSVISDSESDRKFTVNDFALIPSGALIDPGNTVSVPPRLSATTGMDALTHAVEAYIGWTRIKCADADAVRAVKLVFENLEAVYENGENREARKNMMLASYLAGKAFSRKYVGYVHAVAHSLGGRYNVAHGFANAVLLPHVLEEYGKSAYKKLSRLAIETGVADEGDRRDVAAKKFIDAIKEMNARMNIPTFFEEIKADDIREMARHASKEANPLYPVPRLMDASELEKIYYSVMQNA